ncbi:unnamed protein product [Rhizoctonia solani]|uniref:Uncharacterized protein n=1 Tax=Rhizoctonia solani TaxID=456999 RepID=A0A8H2XLU9_9AGAM|nr:unnamed protein product [Rhizoctonia solani]
MNEQSAQHRFPTIRRGITVAASGVAGAPSRTLNQPRVAPPSRFTPILLERNLYEVDTEEPIGKFAPEDDFFMLESAVRSKYPVRVICALGMPRRPPPPPLKDRGDEARYLPKKSISGPRKVKGKKRRKGRPTNEVKRPRHLSENHDNLPPARPHSRLKILKKSDIQIRIKTVWPERRSRADAPIQPRQPHPVKTLGRYKRARKVAFDPPHPLTATPTPTPPPDNRGVRLALDVVAQGIFRLDPALARYSLRSTPLFLARNLRDGWSGKVWSWDKAGTQDLVNGPNNRDPQISVERLASWISKSTRQVSRYTPATVTQPNSSLPRTFCLKLRRFELGAAARLRVPDSAKLAANLYIHNNPGDNQPLVFDLGVSDIMFPTSDNGTLEVPLRIPSLEFHKKNSARSDTLIPFFVHTIDDDVQVSLRALSLPRGIAYVGVLLYGFTEIGTPAEETVTWGDGASRLYSRVDLVGPNTSTSGFATLSQRAETVWLRSSINSENGYRNESVCISGFQAPAYIHFDVEWGVDSAARLMYDRVSKIRPLHPRLPQPDLKLNYRITVQGEHHVLEQTLQPWACAVCSICAPFPTLRVLQVHFERAHPQVQVTINREKRDIISNKRVREIKLVLPPVNFELVSDDDEAIDVPQVVAPSTRIGAMLASRAEFERGHPLPGLQLQPDNDEHFFPAPEIFNVPPGADPELEQRSTFSQSISEAALVKGERSSIVEETPPLDLEPIARVQSHTPEPALSSPIRSVEPEGIILLPYSSRVNNQGRIYDVLRELPTKDFGILAEQVLAAEEELFAKEATWASRAGVEVETERGRIMCALWARWMVTNRNKFIKNPFECMSRFLESDYIRIIADHVGHEELLSFLLLMVTRRFIQLKEATYLMRKFKRYVEQRE